MFLPLTNDQKIAAEAIDGNYVVLAGPGAGKTAVSIQRFMLMRARGIPESDILNLTFTNAAAAESVARVGLMGAENVFRTFHSYAMDLLKREAERLPFKICDTIIPVRGEQFQLTKDLLKMYPAITSYRSLADKLSEWKRSSKTPDEAIEEEYNNGKGYFYALAYRDYERKCRDQGWLDFDGVMTDTVKLLETNLEVRDRNKKKYLSIDEAQDCDITQEHLLKLIYDGNIFFVGDSNQLVYEWRSAQPGNLESFAKQFNAKTLYLGQNFRSTKALVSFLREITPVDNGLASHMMSEREEGVAPTITEYQDELNEVNEVLKKINDPEHTAVIARTNRQLLKFQNGCLARGMKSQILGKKDLWQQNEIRHLLDLAKESKDIVSPASEVLARLISQHNLIYIYQNSGSPNEKNPIENLNDLTKLAAKRGTTPEFLDWFRRLTYARKSAKNPILQLMTVHASKGREFKHVFFIGCNHNMLPHKDGEINEERRIWFVGCSRASDFLNISWYGQSSEFLTEFLDET